MFSNAVLCIVVCEVCVVLCFCWSCGLSIVLLVLCCWSCVLCTVFCVVLCLVLCLEYGVFSRVLFGVVVCVLCVVGLVC